MYDVVIIGSGAAGLTTALTVNSELQVLILTADIDKGANTKLAQGGIAASWQATAEQKLLHVADTLKAGVNTNNLEAVEMLIENSSEAIDFLIDCGVDFDIVGDKYDLTAEGAHSVRRIFHADGDGTGNAIYQGLLHCAQARANITIINNGYVVESEELESNLYQIKYQVNDQGYAVKTNNLVIASGGYGNLFKDTTNSNCINGLNLVMAKQLGLEVSNLHLVQFHPTGFLGSDNRYHLLTESLRGEGARFYSEQSGYFMNEVHPQADLAPRDITSRTVHAKLSDGEQIYLDCSRLNNIAEIDTRFKTVAETVRKCGYNLATDLIPISPVAHYSIGGINIDLNGKTNKPGIYAVGEAAMSGVHGSNRLASNSLLECIVYGIIIGNQIKQCSSYPIEQVEIKVDDDNCLNQVQQILSTACNIVRNDQHLLAARARLLELQTNTNNLLLGVALDIVESCIINQSSGCHFKENCE